jgi:hypothetical protein
MAKEAIQKQEDRGLIFFAEEREKSFDRGKALTHKQVWSALRYENPIPNPS